MKQMIVDGEIIFRILFEVRLAIHAGGVVIK